MQLCRPQVRALQEAVAGPYRRATRLTICPTSDVSLVDSEPSHQLLRSSDVSSYLLWWGLGCHGSSISTGCLGDLHHFALQCRLCHCSRAHSHRVPHRRCSSSCSSTHRNANPSTSSGRTASTASAAASRDILLLRGQWKDGMAQQHGAPDTSWTVDHIHHGYYHNGGPDNSSHNDY